MQDKSKLFIEKSQKINGNRYNYSKVQYINAKTKVTILCNLHGEFLQTPTNHLSNYQCPSCSNNKKKTTEMFIEDAIKTHGNRYDYSKVDYKNTDSPVCIICPTHGEFFQRPDFHINRNSNCPKCSGNVADTTESFIQKAQTIYDNTYDYSKVVYINSRTPISIICSTHGEFQRLPFSHIHSNPLKRIGCSDCMKEKKQSTI